MSASPKPIAASTTPTIASGNVNTSAFWERLWRTAGIQSALCFSIRPEELCVGRLCPDVFPEGDADHVLCVRTLAGPANLERAFRRRGRCRCARVTRRHDLAERRTLGTRRCLFAFHLARHRSGVGDGRELGAPASKPCYPYCMVKRSLARPQ
jgi:hypothetical protein